jgi:transcriptional regulator with XRE-family HTH domain
MDKYKERVLLKNNIKDILKKRGMSQIELSDITNIEVSHLSKIINGKKGQVLLPTGLKISMALGMPLELVFCI